MGADVAALEIRRASAVEKLGSCRVAVELSLGPIIQEGRINFRCTMQICSELGMWMIQGNWFKVIIIHLIHLSYFFWWFLGDSLRNLLSWIVEKSCVPTWWIRQVETCRNRSAHSLGLASMAYVDINVASGGPPFPLLGPLGCSKNW